MNSPPRPRPFSPGLDQGEPLFTEAPDEVGRFAALCETTAILIMTLRGGDEAPLLRMTLERLHAAARFDAQLAALKPRAGRGRFASEAISSN